MKLLSSLKKPLRIESIFLFFVAAGILAWSLQVGLGIGETGKNRPVFWGGYIASYVYWIGISCAASLFSSVIRLFKLTKWFPLLPVSDLSALAALTTGALFPLIHLGRPELFYMLVPLPNNRQLWPNFHSPLVWDFLGINAYLLGNATLFLLLPDIRVEAKSGQQTL